MASVEPVAAGIAGWLAFSEKPDAFGFAGTALVLAAIVIINIKGKKRAA